MNKYLCAVVGAMFTILFSITAWWVARVEHNIEITEQLQFKDLYLNGQVKAAPVEVLARPPAVTK